MSSDMPSRVIFPLPALEQVCLPRRKEEVGHSTSVSVCAKRKVSYVLRAVKCALPSAGKGVAEGSSSAASLSGSIVISPPLAREASAGVRFGVPVISATMLNSLEAIAGKISPGSGKNSPSTPNGTTTSELIDSNGNNKLLSGYHLRTKLPYQKPGLSNNNNNCNVVNNTPAAAGIVPGGGGIKSLSTGPKALQRRGRHFQDNPTIVLVLCAFR
uniref:Uncharacterized protein n=1 Tax=Anopheles culicifacies TaxID=139723 RepID=A0A182MG24_9DIPT